MTQSVAGIIIKSKKSDPHDSAIYRDIKSTFGNAVTYFNSHDEVGIAILVDSPEQKQNALQRIEGFMNSASVQVDSDQKTPPTITIDLDSPAVADTSIASAYRGIRVTRTHFSSVSYTSYIAKSLNTTAPVSVSNKDSISYSTSSGGAGGAGGTGGSSSVAGGSSTKSSTNDYKAVQQASSNLVVPGDCMRCSPSYS